MKLLFLGTGAADWDIKSKAHAQGMCERPQNRLLLKVRPWTGCSDFLIPHYT